MATLATGLIAGVFYDWSVSVTLGLADLPDASCVATMNAITERIGNPLFFASFFGAALFLILALALHLRRPRSGRFWLVVHEGASDPHRGGGVRGKTRLAIEVARGACTTL